MNEALPRNAELTFRMWSGFSKPRCPLSLLSAMVRRLPPWRPILSDCDYDNLGSCLDRHGRPSPVSGEDGRAFSDAESEAGSISERQSLRPGHIARGPATSASSVSNSRTFKTEA